MTPRSIRPVSTWGSVAALAVAVLASRPADASRQLWSTAAGDFSTIGNSTASAGDFNGDGFGDVIVGVPNSGQSGPGQAWIYLGAPQATDPTRVTLIGNRPWERFGSFVSGVGDLDADGFSDVVVTSSSRACIYRGGASVDTSADLQISVAFGELGSTVAAAGDWNGDGYDDFMLGPPHDLTGGAGGRVFVYFGGATLEGTPDAVLAGAEDDQFGYSLAGGVDVNGDGFDDLVVGAPHADDPGASLTDCGEVLVYFGGPYFDSTPDLVVKGTSAIELLGLSAALLVDFDSDGNGDIAVGARDRIFVFHGGPSLDPSHDWTVGASGIGQSLAAGDVNRDHASDLVTSGFNDPLLIYFGGAAPDTLPDAPLSVPFSAYRAVVAAAGDVNRDGYDDWLIAKLIDFGNHFHYTVVGLFTAHGDLQLVEPNGDYDQHLLGGAPYLAQWAGPEIADIEYSRDGNAWQTLVTGAGGAAANSATVTIPLGRARGTARVRVSSVTPADTIIDLSDHPFSVNDSVQTNCFGTTPSNGATAVTWSAEWPGFPGANRLYRLFRKDPGAFEFLVGPDTLSEEGWRDPTGAPGSRYRLTALEPGGMVTTLDSITVGAFSCDSIQLESPNGGESLFLGNAIGVTWTGSRLSVDVLLSRDDGATWETVETGAAPPTTVMVGTSPATSHARIRTAIHGVGGAVYDDSDAPFTIRTDIQLQSFTALPAGGGGMAVSWQTNPVADPPATFLGFRLCRDDTTAGAPAIGPWPNSGTGYVDPAGTPQSVYRLWAVLNTYQELPLGTIGPNLPVPTPPGVTTFGPSPAGAHDEIALTMPSPLVATGSATDVEVRVYDLRGRDVALLGRNLGAGGTVTVRWTPAAYGLRAGIYWMRVRSASARFEQTHRIVVL